MTTRDDIVANALWGADHEPDIHYTMGSHRGDALEAPPRTLPLYTDCSGFVTLLYQWAGAPDPNGLDYLRLGFTGTLLMHLPEIGMGEAQPGDLIVYGPGTGDHVVVIIEPGDDPLTVSHGQEAGPIRVRHSVEARAHKPPVRVLRGLDVPTPQPPDPQPTPATQEAPRMIVWQLKSNEGSDFYHCWTGQAWVILSGAEALEIAAANGQRGKLPTLSDDTYHKLGGN